MTPNEEGRPTDTDRQNAEQEIRAKQHEVKYDLKDFPIDYLVERFRNDLFYIPSYQREYIWPDGNKCRFVESIILGLPIPMMFFADMEDGRLEIVDGAQRIQTLEEFMNGDLRLNGLTHLGSLNGFAFSDLPEPQQRKFKTRAPRPRDAERGKVGTAALPPGCKRLSVRILSGFKGAAGCEPAMDALARTSAWFRTPRG